MTSGQNSCGARGVPHVANELRANYSARPTLRKLGCWRARSPGLEGQDQEDDSRLRCFRRKDINHDRQFTSTAGTCTTANKSVTTVRRLEERVRELERLLSAARPGRSRSSKRRSISRGQENLAVALAAAGDLSCEDRRHNRDNHRHRRPGSLTSTEAGLISASSERPRWRNW